MTKQETIALLKQQMPSFYSLEQVINIVENIKEFDIDEISTNIAESINNENTRIVLDFDVTIDYSKTIDLEDISFDEDRLVDIIKSSLDEYLQNTKEETGA